MNIATLEHKQVDKPAALRLDVVDCDIHPATRTRDELLPFLSKRWQQHYTTYGAHVRQGLLGTMAYPRMSPGTARADSFPPNGGPPASDLDFMRQQHLDANRIEYGILHPLGIGGYDQRNQDFGAALCSAINDWQLHTWIEREPRLRASIYVAQDFPEAAVAEIERRADNPDFVQISCAPHALEPLGRRRYWPIWEAAERSGRPVGLHIGGMSGHAPTGSGWPSFYFEHHFSQVPALESVVTSMVLEGVFERFPGLKVVFVEGGFAWAPPLCWRLDQHWARMRDEVPHVKRPPSEYIRENVWYTTQPIEEPDNPDHLVELIDWLGWDRLLFSSDYPHWDFDDPSYAFKFKMTKEQRDMIFRGNAKSVYRLP
jgi:predicted TIM-barrel fold metal-dependent hydrolase